MRPQLTQHRDPESGLLSWKQVDRGFSLELIQLLPDYVKALYSSRGLPKSVVDGMAPYCVFGSVVINHAYRAPGKTGRCFLLFTLRHTCKCATRLKDGLHLSTRPCCVIVLHMRPE